MGEIMGEDEVRLLWVSGGDGLAILLVEQLALLALDIADDAYVLQSGKVALSGPAREPRGNPAVVESYLG